LPFVAGKLSVGYGYKTKVGRNIQCCLHRNEAAGVKGRGGRCHSEPYGCNDWNDIFSHGLLLVEAIFPVTPSDRHNIPENHFEAPWVPILHITKLRECSAVAAIW
jgi:hypothetical protein